MNKSDLAEMDTKKNIPFMLISLSLILLNVEAISLNEIINKIISVNIQSKIVATILLWLVWAYLLLQYIHSYKLSGQNLLQKIKREFDGKLARYSRKKKEKKEPGLYTPQYLVTPKSKLKLSWECKYCQATRGNLEPSVTIRVTALPVIIMFISSSLNVLLEIQILLNIVIPLIFALLAVLSLFLPLKALTTLWS